jgi:hypothetical protein
MNELIYLECELTKSFSPGFNHKKRDGTRMSH